jgi:coenzyme PQQ precursor peptide PqqA
MTIMKHKSGFSSRGTADLDPNMSMGGQPMWTKPKIVEIAVGMEINAYACAEIA